MGKNQMATLKEVLGSATVGRTDTPTIAIGDVWWHPKGHRLRHPRADDPVLQDLRDDIVENGVVEPIVLRLGQHHGRWRAELCDGACRTLAGAAAEGIMRERGSKLLDADGHLRVKTIWIKCDDAEFLLRRRAADRQALKRPHSVRVTCDEIRALSACEVEPKRILDGLSHDWTLSVVAVVAELWHTADAALRERLNVVPGLAPDGVPPGILPAVLKASAEVRLRVLADLLESGVTSPGGAARTLGRLRAEAEDEAEPGLLDEDDEDIEHDGLDSPKLREADKGASAPVHGGRRAAEPDEVEEPATEAPAKARRSAGGTAPSPRLNTPKEAPHRRVVRKLAEGLASRTRTTEAERLFALGAQSGLPREEVRDVVAKALASVPEAARWALAGVLWGQGIFGTGVQRALPEKHRAEVLALVEGTKVEKTRASKGGK